jgi:hypothetical protein
MTKEVTGRAKGGKARADKLSPEKRTEIARKAALARGDMAKLPIATHIGELKIGSLDLPCAVLPGGTRVISQGGVATAFGPVTGGWQLRKRSADEHGGDLPPFLVAASLKSFISNDLRTLVSTPTKYRDPRGGPVRLGIEASLLPKICEVWLQAKDAGALTKIQRPVADRANVLMRGLAHTGVIALVDEATGYQKDRARDALAKILEAFVAKEIQPYVKTFPADYYEHLFRLYNLPYPPTGNKGWRPAFFGHITNEVVYSRIAPDLLPELKKSASRAEKKSKLHQWLTNEVGHPKLRDHLTSIVAILKLSKSPKDFIANVNIVHPRYGDTKQLDFDEHPA